MPEYRSPGVYVEEVPSAVQPIAGASTSIAGFVGVIPDTLYYPGSMIKIEGEKILGADGNKDAFALEKYPVNLAKGSFKIKVDNKEDPNAKLANNDTVRGSQVVFETAPADNAQISCDYEAFSSFAVEGEEIGVGDGKTKTFNLKKYPVNTAGSFEIMVDNTKVKARLLNDDTAEVSRVEIDSTESAPAIGKRVLGKYEAFSLNFSPAAASEVKLCTGFSEFKKAFGDFAANSEQNKLAHAIFGFFNNGGTRCHVMRFSKMDDLLSPTALAPFELVDEISIVAAPGISDKTVQANLLNHCAKMGDRFAILDSSAEINGDLTKTKISPPANSNLGAFYFPWIEVFDPATKLINPDSDGHNFVPPSGHLAGIYARVDNERGVHKAPANEVIRGALGVKYKISKPIQDGLNPDGINCIRDINGNIRVWGARTLGGDANTEWKYINVRRTFLFLRESIDEGTQWVVFEPNTPALWQKITRNVSAFLTNVWRAGALFGNTPQEAFYVKCDAETNPPELRELGQVVTEIGVAIVRPAEFVIFRLSQWAGQSK